MVAYLILPGGWAGGWQSREVARCLEQAGCTVFAPTLTHLNGSGRPDGRQADLDAHAGDVLGLIEREDLRDVILVGFGLSGDVVARVAERAPECIRRLVYVDARVPEKPVQMAASSASGPQTLPETAAPALPHTFVRCTAGSVFSAGTAPAAYRARAAGWGYRELPVDGESRVALPEEVAETLLDLV